MTDDTTWRYAGTRTTLGALQRGLGRGAFRAAREPGGADAVLRCVVRDHRWDRMVDERAVYLARLVRAARVPVRSLLVLLDARPEDSDDNTFDNTLAVLGALGRGGDRTAIDGLREYVGAGRSWVRALEHIAGEWPRQHWDDLLPTARARLSGPGDDVFWHGGPWTDWAATDDRMAAEAGSRRVPRRPRPLRETPVEALFDAVGAGDVPRRRAALTELNCRGPQPGLLPMLDRLPLGDLHGPAGRALDLLGDRAVPVARRWAATPEHPMRWRAYGVLAAHGDDTDVPALLSGWDWLDSRPDDRCGYDQLATGLARIGGATARTVAPRLHRLWHSPHSYERAAYLRALLALDPDRVQPRLTEGLWDCEADVRRLAAAHAPAGGAVTERLAFLAGDPMEAEEVRAAARARLA